MKFAVLITCFNRVETTLICLRHLTFMYLPKDVEYDVWLNDDGSSDGTGEKVAKEFPWIHIVKGTGRDFWCGGMRRVWEAAAGYFDYDGFLWLNDDTILHRDAFELLLSCPQHENAIVVGATCSAKSGDMTYSGWDDKMHKISPDGTYHLVSSMNGNCVWVPLAVFHKIGNFQPYFTHALGDIDYGLRARKLGLALYLAPRYIGTCEANSKKLAWQDGSIAINKRIFNLYSPTGGPEPNIFFKFNLCHFGFFRALRVFVQQHIHVLFPCLWR